MEEVEQQKEAVKEANPPVQITVNDLNSIAAIINAACSRGAFKAEEYSQVGAVIDKLNAFLKHIAEQQNNGVK
jgi:hypothetical protein